MGNAATSKKGDSAENGKINFELTLIHLQKFCAFMNSLSFSAKCGVKIQFQFAKLQ